MSPESSPDGTAGDPTASEDHDAQVRRDGRALLVLVAGCGSMRQDVGAGQEDGAGPEVVAADEVCHHSSGQRCPPHDADGSAAIDWVPFVRVDGLMFQAAWIANTPTVRARVAARRDGADGRVHDQ